MIKIVLIFFIIGQSFADWAMKSPCSAVKEIQLSQNEWILMMSDSSVQHFNKAKIIIHNELFQLIYLSNAERNKILVLFNDQIPRHKLQLLHLKQLKN